MTPMHAHKHMHTHTCLHSRTSPHNPLVHSPESRLCTGMPLDPLQAPQALLKRPEAQSLFRSILLLLCRCFSFLRLLPGV